MHFGINLPNFGAFGDPNVLVQLARDAEKAGWDGFFLWDHMIFDDLPRTIVDPWVALAAVAASTSHIRIGTMLTPLARRRPWKLARETTTLDYLSQGRFTLGAGLGDPAKWEYGFFHEEEDARLRAEKLDEGLEILTGLWSGQPFKYQGKHFHLEEMTFLPPPVQQPRIPIWIGGWWPNKRPFRRAARFDGVFPGRLHGELTPDDWRDILRYINEHRNSTAPFDAAHSGKTPQNPDKAAETISQYAQAGVTWWIEDISPYRYGLEWDQPWPDELVEQLKNRVRQGPVRVE
jgi:alkanesulfonate monooxygenase SsuD/methylene tetrahydromethanopterin reductase-like flavin-dependent oxidoreductase (luciferase family)